MREGTDSDGRTREQRLDRIATIVSTCRGYNHGNPRYFAEMFADTMLCNDSDEQIVLTELEAAVRRIAAEQEKAWTEAAAEYALELQETAREHLEGLQ